MVAETSRGERKPFPEIRIIVTGGRRRTHCILGPVLQAVAALGLVCAAMALGYLGVGRIAAPHRVAHQEKAALRTEITNTDLQDAVARLQDKIARTADDRSALKTRLSALAGKAAALRDQLAATKKKLRNSRALPQPAANPDQTAQLRQALARVRGDVHALKAESATLAARLNKTEADRAVEDARNRRTQLSLAAAQRAAQRLGNAR